MSHDEPPLPAWCERVRAGNPGPMTLEGTNTYVLRGAAGNIVVDPGPDLPEHVEAVAALGPVALAVLTHWHHDHSGGAALLHQLTGTPVVGRDPQQCLGGARLPADGSLLPVAGFEIRVVDTPGHTADSICLLADDGSARTLFSGDTILGRGTTAISAPDGALGPYLDSLARLAGLVTDPASGHSLLLPGHGPARADAGAVIEEYAEHRRQRLDEVRTALSAGAHTAREVVEIVYPGVDPAVLPAAERTVQAALDYLRAAR